MESLKVEKKVILSGKYEDIISVHEHYYLISKKHKVAVLPYTISSNGLLDKVGVVKDYNYILDKYDHTLINGYVSQDDGTNLVAANRILFDILGLNITNADDWMYLGSLYSVLTSDSPIYLYCVDVTLKNMDKIMQERLTSDKKEFKMIDSSFAVTSDDMLLLSSFTRLFNFFYVNSLSKNNE